MLLQVSLCTLLAVVFCMADQQQPSPGAALDVSSINDLAKKPTVKLDPKLRKALLKVLTRLDEEDKSTAEIKQRDNQQKLQQQFQQQELQQLQLQQQQQQKQQQQQQLQEQEQQQQLLSQRSTAQPDFLISGQAFSASTTSGKTEAVFPTPNSPAVAEAIVKNNANATAAEAQSPTRPTGTEVDFFEAPLLTAFTVQQDSSGVPRRVIPIYTEPGQLERQKIQALLAKEEAGGERNSVNSDKNELELFKQIELSQRNVQQERRPILPTPLSLVDVPQDFFVRQQIILQQLQQQQQQQQQQPQQQRAFEQQQFMTVEQQRIQEPFRPQFIQPQPTQQSFVQQQQLQQQPTLQQSTQVQFTQQQPNRQQFAQQQNQQQPTLQQSTQVLFTQQQPNPQQFSQQQKVQQQPVQPQKFQQPPLQQQLVQLKNVQNQFAHTQIIPSQQLQLQSFQQPFFQSQPIQLIPFQQQQQLMPHQLIQQRQLEFRTEPFAQQSRVLRQPQNAFNYGFPIPRLPGDLDVVYKVLALNHEGRNSQQNVRPIHAIF